MNNSADNLTYTYVFNIDERDDSLLYQRLCDKERMDFLEEEFNKDNERRKNDVKNNSTRHNNQ